MNSAFNLSCAAATAGILMCGVAIAKTTDIGKAEVVVPDVKSTSAEQQERVLQVGTDVFRDDIVKTGPIGAAMLQFNDKTTLKIFPNSAVKLDNYVYDDQKSVLRVGLNLLSGAMRIASGGPHSADKYQLRTPQATIGIRGTVIHIVTDGERTIVEALHGTFHACATSGSACQTVSATDEMNALHLWNDGRIELARARRDLGVRSTIGSSDISSAAVLPAGVLPIYSTTYNLTATYLGTITNGSFLADNGVQFIGSFGGLGNNTLAISPASSSIAPIGSTGAVGASAAPNEMNGLVPENGSSFQASGPPSAREESASVQAPLNALISGFFEDLPSSSARSGGGSGGAPSSEVNAGLGILLAALTFIFLRRRHGGRHDVAG
jgi:hypothetical protein